MNKLKNWLRIKLKKYLDIENLEWQLDGFAKSTSKDLKAIQKDYNDKVTYLRKLINNNSQDISHFQESVNALHNTVENVVHIGTDIEREPNGHSWAAICIEGNINIVKFMDLSGRDARDVMYFLKQFEAGRHCIDTPYKQMFDGLFKF